MFRFLLLASLCLLASLAVSAQSLPAAEGSGLSVWVGAEVSTFNPDYGCANSSPFSCGGHQLIGIAPFADVNHFLFRRIGAEGEARFMHWGGPGTVTESTYLVGPRVGLLSFKRKLYLSGKVLVGDAKISLPPKDPGNGSYFAYAPGVVVEYRATRRIFARAEYEYQLWPAFKGISTATTNGKGGLTPNGFSLGLSYAVLRR